MLWVPEVNSNIPPRGAFEGGYVLGLDIGTSSVGWAAVGAALVDGKPAILSGVRIFSEGTLKEKGKEQPRNAARREARQARRQGERRRRRWRKVAHVLSAAGLLPTDPSLAARLQALDPYELRDRARRERLEPFEIGRAFYHLSKRRGFKSSRKADAAPDSDTGPVKEGISQLTEEMSAFGHETLGQHFAAVRLASPHPAAGVRVRNHYLGRQMVAEEFARIWEAQSQHHPELLTDDLRREVEHAIFYQRPLKPAAHLIGRCSLEPEEPRASQESWYVHQFRVLQEIANIRIIDRQLGQDRPLSLEERQRLLEAASTTTAREMKFDSIRKKLKLGDFDHINLDEAERGGIKPQIVEANLRKIFKDRWKTDAAFIRNDIWERFIDLEDDEAERVAREEWKLTGQQLLDLRKVRAGSGYSRFSLKAIKRLLPHLEGGSDLHQALEKEYPERAESGVACDWLPPVGERGLVNPVVTRALSETRKVVNALIREYGKPARIVIELARETKGTIKQREQKNKINAANRRERDRAKKELTDKQISDTPLNITKYRLWEECERKCPYTGAPIGFRDLFGENPRFDIEHIFPYTMSYDNSFMNLTLCEMRENRERKQNKIPRDAYAGDPARFEEILQRVDHMKRMPFEKRRRFRAHEVTDDFRNSQLTDTSYAAKKLREHLQQLGVQVSTTRGPITAELRRFWGLNTILPRREEIEKKDGKERADHRHHAIDAVVVACTEPRHVNRLGRKFAEGPLFGLEAPWESFRPDVEKSVLAIHVSQRPEHKLQGVIFEETNYGYYESGPNKGKFVRRVSLDLITHSMIDDIADASVREAVLGRLEERGIIKGSKIPSHCFEDLRMPCRKGVGPLIKRVRVIERQRSLVPIPPEEPIRYLKSKVNHHIALYRLGDEYCPRVCTRFDALRIYEENLVAIMRQNTCDRRQAKRLAKNEWRIVAAHPEQPNAKMLFYLMKGDPVLYLMDEGEFGLYYVESICQPPATEITLRLHTDAIGTRRTPPECVRIRSFARRNLELAGNLRLQKVTVDPLGRIWPCNDAADD